MAKETKKVSFSGAILDIEKMTISEFDREGNEVAFDLYAILSEYHNVPGVSLAISKCEDINGQAPDEMEDENDY